MTALNFCINVFAAVALTAATASYGEAVVSRPPDPQSLLRIRALTDSADRVRVTTRRATYVVLEPRIDFEGITVAYGDHPAALFGPGVGGQPERRVKWAEIERVDAERTTVARGALWGAVIALGVTAAGLAITRPDFRGEEGLAYLSLFVAPPLGAIAGAVAGGSSVAYRIYPLPGIEGRR